MDARIDALSDPKSIQPQHTRQWSNLISENSDNIEKLQLLCHNRQQLEQVGYVLQALSEKQILSKVKCLKCKERYSAKAGVRSIGKPSMPKLKCMFHTGRVSFKVFTCCGQPVKSKGCTFSPEHSFATNSGNRALRENWAFHITTQNQMSSRSTKNGQQLRNNRKAVALDCEMGVSKSGDSELIKLTMIDFFTAEVLIDSLVHPNVPMLHYNTRYSGVTAAAMNSAVQKRSCIFGRDAARRRIWDYVDPNNTAVIMHGGSNDLRALRWIHSFIIDTFILQKMWGAEDGGHSLRNLCDKKLGIAIQNGRNGHCSLEDAMACRELLYWFMQQIPNSTTSPYSSNVSNPEGS